MIEYYGHNDWCDYHLSHHGILGMKWGIRRFQPYGHGGYQPKKNDYFVMKKGTTLTRFSSVDEKDIRKGAYYSYTPNDVYEYSKDAKNGQIGIKKGDKVFTIHASPKNDIKIAKAMGIIKDIVKEIGDEKITNYHKILEEAGYLDEQKTPTERMNMFEKNESIAEARAKLGTAMHKQVYKNLDSFLKKYGDKKYAAIIDPEDYVWNYEKPLIIIDPDQFEIKN